MSRELIYWSMVQKIWGIKASKVLSGVMSKFTGKEFWQADLKTLRYSFPEITSEMLDLFITKRKNISLEKEYEKLLRLGIKIISMDSEIYPKNLKNIFIPPPLLYVKGNLKEKNLAIAIVGSRKATAYGKKVSKDMASRLSNENVQIISGLARGIDAFAHKGSLLGKGGTIAVLGSGLDVIYPRENESLFKEIISSNSSAVISEFPLGTPPLRYNFPMRNRIISGISDGILVVEASKKSGSLITIEYGLEQGKDIFAIPGPIYSDISKGCHKLIKEGAKLVEGVEDILEEYGQMCLFKSSPRINKDLNGDESIIVKSISSIPLTVEQIADNTKIPLTSLISILGILEIKGFVKQLAGRKFISIN